MKRYLAIDIGASSGRHIVGWIGENGTQTQEVYRFSNGPLPKNGHLVWDTEYLLVQVRQGIDAALSAFAEIESLSIDTWGVDYVLLKGDTPVSPCYAYRDNRTESAVSEVAKLISPEQLYERTGIQFQPFNTLYQLYADQKAGLLDGVTDFLMLPEYLMWRLTGVKKKEYTNATTTGLLSAKTATFDRELISLLGLPAHLFPPLSQPGTELGTYRGIRVVLCATHDTASAVEGIPMEDDALYLSSGTWSLLGAKLKAPLTNEESRKANFTNEGGAGYIRYLKNIMGLWIIQCLQKQLGLSFSQMTALAEESSYTACFDVNDPRFTAPADMKIAICSVLQPPPEADGDLLCSVYRSLALSYHRAICELESLTNKPRKKLYIVGGGAKNTYLNRLTAQMTGKTVIALPIEATALGNLKLQMEASHGQLFGSKKTV